MEENKPKDKPGQGVGGGRPMRVFSEDEKREIGTLAGFTPKKFIADYLGINRVTFDAMLERDPEVNLLYQKGAAKTLMKASKTLIWQACGDDDNPPNITALIFFLKTRGQGEWKETIAQEITGANGGPVTTQSLSSIPDDELKAMLDKIENAKSISI